MSWWEISLCEILDFFEIQGSDFNTLGYILTTANSARRILTTNFSAQFSYSNFFCPKDSYNDNFRRKEIVKSENVLKEIKKTPVVIHHTVFGLSTMYQLLKQLFLGKSRSSLVFSVIQGFFGWVSSVYQPVSNSISR